MINNVVLVGRLVRDPEVRTAGSGNIPVVSFTLAVNRNYKSKDGSQDADFINCVAWRSQAEFLGNYAHKGTLIGIVGRLQTRSYVPNDATNPNQRVYVTEVQCDSVQILTPKNAQGNQQQTNNFGQGGFQPNNFMSNSPMQSNTPDFSATPMGQDQGLSSDLANASTGVDFGSNENVSEISDDDLPFL